MLIRDEIVYLDVAGWIGSTSRESADFTGKKINKRRVQLFLFRSHAADFLILDPFYLLCMKSAMIVYLFSL